MSHCGDDETGLNALFYMDLNNRQTGKHATKPRALGLLGHSVYIRVIFITQNIGLFCDLWGSSLPKLHSNANFCNFMRVKT